MMDDFLRGRHMPSRRGRVSPSNGSITFCHLREWCSRAILRRHIYFANRQLDEFKGGGVDSAVD